MSKCRGVFVFLLFSFLSSSVYSSTEELDSILDARPKTPVTAGNLALKQETRVDILMRAAVGDDLPKKAAAWMQLAEIYADTSEGNSDSDPIRASQMYDELLHDSELFDEIIAYCHDSATNPVQAKEACENLIRIYGELKRPEDASWYEAQLFLMQKSLPPEGDDGFAMAELELHSIVRDYHNFLGNPYNGIENPVRVKELEDMLGWGETKV